MAEALYGERGFYRRPGAPAEHFRTAAHAGAAWADAISRLASRVDAALREPPELTIADVGAGGGELLAGLARIAPERWRLVGVDVCPRPASLPDRVAWSSTVPRGFVGLLIAVEWLDVVPVDVVERTDDGVRFVEVAPDGSERLAGPVDATTRRWLDAWWPLAAVGDRAEVGHPRDDAWRAAVAGVDRGVALAVDYAADPQRDVAGTLTGYREGRQVAPVPDGSCDVTAHVLMEACLAAADSDAGVLLSQRDALRALGVEGRRPAYEGDPLGYLHALSGAGEVAELLDPGGLGGFTWLLHAKGIPLPL